MSGELLRRLRFLVTYRRRVRELDAEMAMHREMAARDGSRRPFGDDLRLREDVRDAWGWTWIDRALQDLRYAIRTLRRSPGFTLVAIVMLALGLGANIAAFGFFNLMVLRPLPVREPETLVRLERRAPEAYAAAMPYPEMAFVRAQARSLSAILAITSSRLRPDGDSRTLTAHFVTDNFFDELGAPLVVGRGLDARDARPGAQPVAVLANGFWERRYAADPSVVGRTLRLDGLPTTVIGVAAPQFAGLSLDSPDVWLPIERQPSYVAGSTLLTDYASDGTGVQVFGRLRPGVTPAAAEDELRSVAQALRKEHPEAIWEGEWLRAGPGGFATGLMNVGRRGTGPEPPNRLLTIFSLLAALVLLILVNACANLGGLLLARGVSREREMAIRIAVGAGRGRLLRQLLTESLVLALLGSAAGLVCGYWALRGLMTLTDTPAWLDPTPDWRVVAFAIAMSWAAAVFFGLTPALQAARLRRRPTAAREVLIAVQVAASAVLLIVASLLVRAVVHASATDPGFDVQHVLAVNPDLRAHGYTPSRARVFVESLADRLDAVPGLAAVAVATQAPLGRGTVVMGIELDGRPLSMLVNHVDPKFFETMRMPILAGRAFAPHETRALVVSDGFARRAWPGRDPLGRQLDLGPDAAGAPVLFTVVGLVGGARVPNPNAPDALEVYFPIEPDDWPSTVMLVRTSRPTARVSAVIADAARALDSSVFPGIEPLASGLERRVQSTKYVALSVGLLGLCALSLACLGIAGLVTYAVAQRTTEIGIRVALGAQPAHVLFVFARRFVRPVLLGLLAGIAGAAMLSQMLRGQLLGLSPLDPLTYVACTGLFLLVATGATLVPARRALALDPLTALRHD